MCSCSTCCHLVVVVELIHSHHLRFRSSERLFTELLPLGQLHLLLEFVSYLAFHCSANLLFCCNIAKLIPRIETVYPWWQTESLTPYLF